MATLHSSLARGAAAAALLVAVAAAPVAAAAPAQSRWSDTYSVDHACGIVETTTVTTTEKAFFDGNVWVRSVMSFTFDGLYTGPTGKTYAATSHQNGTFTPSTGALAGQGSFLRGAGGVLVMDAGRLVFQLDAGQTIHASARVIRFDDPNAPDLDAALCAKLG